MESGVLKDVVNSEKTGDASIKTFTRRRIKVCPLHQHVMRAVDAAFEHWRCCDCRLESSKQAMLNNCRPQQS